MKKQQRGFTLIEILIVVAIIAILSSVVLVGLGPTQQQGRDARRLSDLREVQTGLELYYNRNGYYPAETTWSAMATDLTTAGIGVSQVPNDPTNGATYWYSGEESDASGNDASYVIGAHLESASSSAFNGYVAPSVGVPTGMKDCAAASRDYCLSI